MEERLVACPYCGETITLLVDPSIDEQQYYEDCSVCCCPILVDASKNDNNHIIIMVKADNE